jgi:hypothetical protein
MQPWEQLPSVWKTKAAYFQWLRGQMRKAWSRHPIKVQFKKSKSFLAPKGKLTDKKTGLPKMVKCQTCACCGGTFRDAETQVDHIIQAGSFRDWDECQIWMMGLMQVNFEGLQVLCKVCHDTKSYAETNHCTFKEAQANKSYIAWNKVTPIPEQQELLRGEGYNDVGNVKLRRAAYLDLYRKAT